MKYTIFLLAITLFLAACNTTTEKSTSSSDETVRTVDDTATVVNADKKPTQVLLDSLTPPVLDSASIYILVDGSFHAEDIPATFFECQWSAVAYDQGGMHYDDNIDLEFEQVHDPVVDGEGQKTGWKTKPPENSFGYSFFVSGLEMETHAVNFVELPQKFIHPNDTFAFELEGKSYKIYATGTVDSTSNLNPKPWINYKLFLDDGETSELIVANHYYDGHMMELLFVGDIDQDKRPDILMDTSESYNKSVKSLFLSTYAKNSLLKLVAQHVSYGC